ncbi:hypothetical protein [Pseudomonas soli]|uniref:hypothetical protein n=1 Tax=Pseudomonas soli TaxID=1306993 RepID=UPI003D028DB8
MISLHRKFIATATLFFIILLLPFKTYATSATDNSLPLYVLESAASREAIDQLPSSAISAELAVLLAEPTTEEIALLRVNLDAVAEKNEVMSITLPGRQEVHFVKEQFKISSEGRPLWIGAPPSDRKQRFPSPGEVKMDPLDTLFIQRYPDHIRAEIRLAGQAYRLEPAGAGLHALIKVHQAQTTCEPVTDDTQAKAAPASVKAGASHSTITYLIVSTDEARRTPLLEERIANSLTFAQQFLDNSGVDITFTQAGYYEATYTERNKTKAQVFRDFRFSDTPFGKLVLAEREKAHADIVLVVSGLVDGTHNDEARKESAFAIVKANALAEEIIHQVGHVMGVDHTWKEGDIILDPPYQFAYLMPFAGGSNGTATLMGQYDTCGGCGIGMVFSNPRKTYMGHPMGTVEHNDAVRRLNEQREKVENYY